MKDKGYGSIEEVDVNVDPVGEGHSDLPDPEPEKDRPVDPEIRRKAEQARAQARRLREEAELGSGGNR